MRTLHADTLCLTPSRALWSSQPSIPCTTGCFLHPVPSCSLVLTLTLYTIKGIPGGFAPGPPRLRSSSADRLHSPGYYHYTLLSRASRGPCGAPLTFVPNETLAGVAVAQVSTPAGGINDGNGKADRWQRTEGLGGLSAAIIPRGHNTREAQETMHLLRRTLLAILRTPV